MLGKSAVEKSAMEKRPLSWDSVYLLLCEDIFMVRRGGAGERQGRDSRVRAAREDGWGRDDTPPPRRGLYGRSYPCSSPCPGRGADVIDDADAPPARPPRLPAGTMRSVTPAPPRGRRPPRLNGVIVRPRGV